MADLPSVDDVYAARERIRQFVRETPTVFDDGLAYKLDFFQPTGSFKVRGAFNAALRRRAQGNIDGIVTMSGGNHGLAVAYVGRLLRVHATILMPQTTPAYVVERAQADGATVKLTPTIGDAISECARLAAEEGRFFLHPFDNADVIAGQGTIGLEILEQYPSVSQVVISIGGGGLISGIASVLKQLRPDVHVAGVETRGADAMRRALDANAIVRLPSITSIARTLGAPSVSERTLEATQKYVDDVVVVDDADAVTAIAELQQRLGIMVEPAAACTYAALRTGLISMVSNTLLLMCGRNVRLGEIAKWYAHFRAGKSMSL